MDSKFLDFCVVIIETSLAHTAQAGQLPVQNIDLLCQLLSHVPDLAGAEPLCGITEKFGRLEPRLGLAICMPETVDRPSEERD